MKPIINIEEAPEGRHVSHGDVFEARLRPLAEKIGGRTIGANLTTVPPGKAAFPFHHHFANEEHFFVVRGTGVLRFGDKAYPVKAGDYIVTPPGGPELAHQLVNTGTVELAYLAIGTLRVPEVVGYPDSGKTATSPCGFREPHFFMVADSARNAKTYWDDEDGKGVRAVLRESAE
jgi:uncharacterized cupin superfamily protein